MQVISLVPGLSGLFRFSGGPVPTWGLVLGRSSALLRVVWLCGPLVKRARSNAADAVVAADVFLYRDSSLAPLLDMRRWVGFKLSWTFLMP